MALSPSTAIICLEVIPKIDQEKLLRSFTQSKKEVIEISLQQLEHFAGNMLCLKNAAHEHVLVIPQKAYDSLEEHQLNTLSKNHKLLTIAIPAIEKIGGGSVRCMMAELF